MTQERPAKYWTASKVGGRTIVLMPISLPEDERERNIVLYAFIKAGWLVTRVEQYRNGRIEKFKGV